MDLHKYNFINLKTFRKNGQEVITTVWFASQTDKKLVMLTLPHAGKLKRLHNNPHVELAPCNMNGSKTYGAYLSGQARILPKGSTEAAAAKQLMDKKYGWQKKLFDLYDRWKGVEPVYIEIVLD